MPLNKFLRRSFISSVITAITIAISACSSGGGADNRSETPVSGSAVKGVIANAAVHAYLINPDSPNEHLASTRTQADGSFRFPSAFTVDAPTGNTAPLILIEVQADTDTRITCDVLPGCTHPIDGTYTEFSELMAAPDGFRLLGTLNPENLNQAFLSPLSHLILSTAANLSGGLSHHNILTATSWLQDDLGISFNPLSTNTPDLTTASAMSVVADHELLLAVYSASLYEASMQTAWSNFNFTLEELDLATLLQDSADLALALGTNYSGESDQLTAKLSTVADFTANQAEAIQAEQLAIVSHPQSTSAMSGETITLRVAATSNTTISYQWFFNDGQIDGAQSPQLVLSNVGDDDAGLYSVEVSTDIRSERSLSALVTVQAEQLPPTITQQPQHQSLSSGEQLQLSVSAVGSGPLAYTWQRGGSVIPGVDTATLTIPSTTLADAGSYRVTVSNNYGSIASQFADVIVTESIAPVSITSQPEDISVLEGATATFSVSATGGGFISYQWRKDGSAIQGANSSSLLLSNLQLDDGGFYDVLVSNSQGTLTSSSAELNVLSSVVPLIIISQPQSTSVAEGDTAQLSISASGTGTLLYQWYKDGSVISGANQATLIINNSASADQGLYSVNVSDDHETAQSLTALLTVSQLATIDLSWDIPTEREDGSLLSTSEISGYVLEYGYDMASLEQRSNIPGALTQNYTLNNMPSGTLYLRIATTDSDGVTGSFSQTISLDIQ